MNQDEDRDTLCDVEASAKQEVYEEIQLLAERTPALGEAIEAAIRALSQQPQLPNAKRNVDDLRAVVGPALLEFQKAVVNLRGIAVRAKAEQDATQAENAQLQARLKVLEQIGLEERQAKHRVLRWSMALIVLPAAAVIAMWLIGL